MASSSRARFSGPPGRICSFVLPTLVVAIAVAGCDSDSSASLATGPSPIKCQLSLTGTKVIGSEGGPGAIDVTAQPECAWTASTSAAWITDVAPRSGQGTAEVQFRVASNPTAVARESELVVNDERIRIAQEAAECHYEIRPAQWPAAAAGGRGQAELVTLDGCRWDASVDVPWITLVSAASGAGGASVVFDVASNAGGPRTGVITIAGRSLTVTQGALACSYAITPAAYDAPTLGGAAPPVTVSAPATCAWTTNSNVAWLSVTSGSSGSGTGVVTFVVSPNVGGVRTGTIAIADQLLTVTQQPLACLYTVSPLAATVPAAGGPGPSITVTAPAGCAWTAASNDAWLTITAGASGTGPGVVDFDVAANAGAARSGTLTIAGQTFTVAQDAAACTYAIAPASFTAASAGGPGPSVSVTAPAGCAWTAASNDAWLTITAGASGTGPGVVDFDVAANAGAARSGTLTIAGQTFTVAQDAAACTYAIAPASFTAASAGGPGPSVSVTAPAGCAWTAASNDAWLTITAGASGTGPGVVDFDVAANAGAARSGTLTIAGQTFTVTQDAAACTYAISPVSYDAPAPGGAGPSIAVTATAGCAWTAVSNDAWITVDSGSSGTGDGVVTFSVGANAGAPRTGTMTIAGQTFTVAQP